MQQQTTLQGGHALPSERAYQATLAALRQKEREVQDLQEAYVQATQLIAQVRRATEMHLKQEMGLLLRPLLQHLDCQKHCPAYATQVQRLVAYLATPPCAAGTSPRTPPSLSAREWHIAALIQCGSTDAAIADQLCIAPATVKVHRRNIRKKLGLTGTKTNLRAYVQTLQDALPDLSAHSNATLTSLAMAGEQGTMPVEKAEGQGMVLALQQRITAVGRRAD
jgi:DNA-binding NarL/FixJ family response regulator